MNSEYTVAEVVEIGTAQEVILGTKDVGAPDDISALGNVEDFEE